MNLDKEKNYKILTCCGCGNGTCVLLSQTVKKAMIQLGINATVEPNAVSIGKAQYRNYDMIFCNRGLLTSFKDALAYGTPVIGLRNVMSVDEIIKAISDYNSEK